MEENNTQIYTQPRRQLSLLRVLLVVIFLTGLTYGTTLSFENWKENNFSSSYSPWFASYVDVTSVPIYSFEQKGPDTSSDAILSFIVSSHSNPCTPTWGGYYTMDTAAESLDLDRRITRFQQKGGRIAISFGGALNSELAILCTGHEELLHAYKSVVDRYNINTIDLDLENQGLADRDAGKRRADVIAQLQKYYREQNKVLAVWLTLPVAPQGLTKEGTDAISQMLSSNVDIAGINVMIMDYGESRDEKDTMFTASQKALIETHRQLGILYEQAEINLDSSSIWKKIGSTPMIGQNDVLGEIFTLDDAKDLNQFTLNQGIGRMSMWSANRDIPCGTNYVDVKVVSDLCSGVTAPTSAFTRTLSAGFDGDLMQNAKMITAEDHETNTHAVDDPVTSPYQIWKETGAYLKGTKVVWHGNVYEAKWWTKNDLPDNPVLQAWETPWQLIGPVLPNDKPLEQPVLPSNTFPQWSGRKIYDAGDRVLFDSIPFRAKWWNQGESPAASASNPDSSPWIPLTQSQVEEILKSKR